MSIAETDVRHIAALARVGIKESRIPSLVRELNGILDHMDVLQQVAIDDLTVEDSADERRTSLAGPHVLRSDLVPADALTCERESFAPAMRDGFFLVPRLATHGALGASATDVEEGVSA